jgi:hypothetical protein
MTHEFTPDWKLSQQDQLQVHLSIALAKHVPGWPGCTDEQLGAVAADLLQTIDDGDDRSAGPTWEQFWLSLPWLAAASLLALLAIYSAFKWWLA